ncbi:MAG: hypothetical protein LC107_05855 [Chitinophagales bacterium]|nr:hypothetical protein [Chitinophagales bacterium]
MTPKIKFKISKIANLEEAKQFSALHADFLGFCCNGTSLMYCSPSKIMEITNQIQGPEIVYEFDGWQAKAEIDTTVDNGQVDALHFGAFATYKERFSLPVFKDFILENIEDSDLSNVQYPILRSEKQYTQLTKQEKQQIDRLVGIYPIFLDLNLDTVQDLEAIEDLGIAGIVLRSNAKNHQLLSDFVGKTNLVEPIFS